MRNCWIIRGKKDNWRQAFDSNGIWGLKDDRTCKVYWLALTPGDFIVFYVTSPIMGIVGYGTVRTKFFQDSPLWAEEITKGQAIWPFRFEFDVDFVLPESTWQESKVPFSLPKVEFRKPLTITELNDIKQVIQRLNPNAKFESVVEDKKKERMADEEIAKPTHNILKNLLCEIGRLQNYVVNQEYSIGSERLDVVWRRLPVSVPTYVFEVQIGGDLYHAMAKLKHAHDIWNSRIFLVAPKDVEDSVNRLLAGTFHEISANLRFIDTQKVQNLYKSKSSIYEIERELGILP